MSRKILAQGRLLITPTTEKWEKDRAEEADKEERKIAFHNFKFSDNGRSRVFFRRFNSEEECLEYIDMNNTIVNLEQKIKEIEANQKET